MLIRLCTELCRVRAKNAVLALAHTLHLRPHRQPFFRKRFLLKAQSIALPSGALILKNGFHCFLTFSSLFSIKKKRCASLLISITNDACNHSSIWTQTIEAQISESETEKNKSSSHKAQNRSAEYKVLRQILKGAALKVSALLTLQKAKQWHGVLTTESDMQVSQPITWDMTRSSPV